MVRDLLLQRKNRDLDFVIQGNFRSIVEEIADLKSADACFKERFQTAALKRGKLQMDFVLARREHYPYPGALPEVERGTLRQDLYRRDFTVNTLVLDLRPAFFGRLLDFFEGLSDLEKNKLRVLHEKSFFDDPTRIIRGLRLCVELNFLFAKKTAFLAEQALKADMFDDLSCARVLTEIKLLLVNPFTDFLLRFLARYPIFKLLGLEIKLEQSTVKLLIKLEEELASVNKKDYNIEEWLVRFAIICANKLSADIIEKMNLTTRQQKIVLFAVSKKLQELKKTESFLARVKMMERLNPEQLIILKIKTDKPGLKEEIDYYLDEIIKIKLKIDGYDLQEMGLAPGPVIKEVLSQVKKARIRGLIKGREEELAYARQIINKFNNEK